MDQHKVVKLWTAIVTAFLALCTALGLVTTTATAATAAPQPETAPKSTALVPAQTTSSPWSRVHARSLPPTMKQRIRAEAHGKSPSCRHHPRADAPSLTADTECAPAAPPVRPTIPLQR
ncbi:DUF6344 domain-containing protein [Streptomyces naganishii]|uniref:Secreted protein n=1 Tax=Streptomyces naganishii JCM 4654 TaxID=1306179 RepID=A0A918Y066_9ACTN|nr:DUF6344 domain-containing protein [Streptomyces naganishii]GHD85208.1 hypothetical protein GCM10010508_08050 [Streptomyces naganishii JCM 4654]